MDGREEGVWSGYGGHSPRGLDARIRRAIQRLQAYLNNEVPKLDELEVPILPYDDFHQDKGFIATTANQWQIIATASTIYTT